MLLPRSSGPARAQREDGPTILIVEDHARTREVVRDWLSFVFPQARFLEAGTGEEALAAAAKQPPQLVLMDVEMPGMKGIEATRRIKLLAPGTQVVILSIYQAPEYQSAAIAAGASAYLPKASMHTELIPLLRTLLGRPAA